MIPHGNHHDMVIEWFRNYTALQPAPATPRLRGYDSGRSRQPPSTPIEHTHTCQRGFCHTFAFCNSGNISVDKECRTRVSDRHRVAW